MHLAPPCLDSKGSLIEFLLNTYNTTINQGPALYVLGNTFRHPPMTLLNNLKNKPAIRRPVIPEVPAYLICRQIMSYVMAACRPYIIA
jgi:hypothetical protein